MTVAGPQGSGQNPAYRPAHGTPDRIGPPAASKQRSPPAARSHSVTASGHSWRPGLVETALVLHRGARADLKGLALPARSPTIRPYNRNPADNSPGRSGPDPLTARGPPCYSGVVDASPNPPRSGA